LLIFLQAIFYRIIEEDIVSNPYAAFPGHVNITYSELIPDSSMPGGSKVIVSFKHPTVHGFTEAQFSLPDYQLLSNSGLSVHQLERAEEVLKRNGEEIFSAAKAKAGE
jgi:hypothetical protein